MNPIKPSLKTEIIPLVSLLAVAISSIYFYNHFGESVPTHWNFQGQVDGWSSRWTAAFMMPALSVVMYLMFLGLPYLDPKKERYEQFSKVYHVFKAIFIVFIAIIYFVVGFNGLGYNMPISSFIPAMVGFLFIVIGNYMSKIKPNWFMGIRTPWTLSSEEVWNKTHRLGAKLFIVGGLLMMFINAFPEKIILPLFVLIVTSLSLGTFGYSYYLYNQEEKKKNGENNQSTKPTN